MVGKLMVHDGRLMVHTGYFAYSAHAHMEAIKYGGHLMAQLPCDG